MTLPKVMLFDLDDTIVSFSVGQSDLWMRVLSEHAERLGGVDPAALAHVVQEVVSPVYWGDAARAAWGRSNMYAARRQVLGQALEHLGLALAEQAVHAAADSFTDEKEALVAPLEDAPRVLSELRSLGVRLGLITNGSSAFQRKKLARYGLEPHFELILIEEEWGVGKPDASIFAEALRALSISAEQTWMIGDNFEADIEGAAELGIPGIWLHHGRPLPASRVAPLAVIGHVRELLPGRENITETRYAVTTPR